MSRIIRRDFYRDLVIVFIIAISIPFMLLLIAALITQPLQAASLTLRTIQALVGVYAMILSIVAYATARKFLASSFRACLAATSWHMQQLERVNYGEHRTKNLMIFVGGFRSLRREFVGWKRGRGPGMFILVLTLILHAYSSKLSI